MSISIFEYFDKKYRERKDRDNIFGVGICDADFRHFIINYLLSDDWYVTDPISQEQVNEIALCEILEKYSKRFKKERKKHKRKEVKSMTDNEKAFDKYPKDKKGENNSWMIPLMLVALMGNSQPNMALEKEVAYLHGKVDTLEKIITERK